MFYSKVSSFLPLFVVNLCYFLEEREHYLVLPEEYLGLYIFCFARYPKVLLTPGPMLVSFDFLYHLLFLFPELLEALGVGS